MESKKVSKKLLARLPMYLNYIRTLPERTENISATKIANALALGDVLVRKDLAKVSNGGRRKVGYLRERLIRDIEAFLSFNSVTNTVIVGAGKLGQALLDYGGFEASGLCILAGFDQRPATEHTRMGKPIFPMEALKDFCEEHNIRIGIIAVPAGSAQEVCDRMVECNIRAIWNFAPVHLMVPEGIMALNENLAISLTTLRMRLKNVIK